MSTHPNTLNIPQFTLGDRMRVSLRQAGCGVQEIADYLDVSRGTVSTWLNDKIHPSKQTMRLWAFRSGVPLEWLETGEVPGPTGPGTSEQYTARDSNPEPIDIESIRRQSLSRPAA